MADLPFVDEHARTIAADADAVWRALRAVLEGQLGGGTPVARLLGAEPAAVTGAWPHLGATRPGFAVTAVAPASLLVLSGRHRFSRYELGFALDPEGEGCSLTAVTRADFPGARGRAYRALVIGSGGHSMVVRRLLGAVDRRVVRAAAG